MKEMQEREIVRKRKGSGGGESASLRRMGHRIHTSLLGPSQILRKYFSNKHKKRKVKNKTSIVRKARKLVLNSHCGVVWCAVQKCAPFLLSSLQFNFALLRKIRPHSTNPKSHHLINSIPTISLIPFPPSLFFLVSYSLSVSPISLFAED
ncbi:hypothetical protein Pfo_003039, partial [Paulownia fortunei]